MFHLRLCLVELGLRHIFGRLRGDHQGLRRGHGGLGSIQTGNGLIVSGLVSIGLLLCDESLLYHFDAALVPSVVLLARHGSAARKMGIPFAPFLALGALIALFFGDQLLNAYLNTF